MKLILKIKINILKNIIYQSENMEIVNPRGKKKIKMKKKKNYNKEFINSLRI